MLRVGLTGGIGSGKSAAAACFRRLGVDVIDSDQLAREVVQPGEPALQQIVDYFGPQVLSADQSLNRQALRQQVMQNPHAKTWLEQLLHPLIKQRREQLIAQAKGPYLILDIPLLLEAGLQSEVDRLLVVDVPEALQIQRTVQRSGMSAEQVRQIMAQQVSAEQRRQAADDLIDNSGTLQQLEARVGELHRNYLALANSAD